MMLFLGFSEAVETFFEKNTQGTWFKNLRFAKRQGTCFGEVPLDLQWPEE